VPSRVENRKHPIKRTLVFQLHPSNITYVAGDREFHRRQKCQEEMDSTKKKAVVAVALGAYATAVAVVISKKKKTKIVPGYRRLALTRQIQGVSTTPWRRILTYGTPADFIVTINITKELLLETLLPRFEEARKTLNFGSPYRRSNSTRGRRPQLTSIDLIGLVLYYLKSRDPLYKLCPIFGVVPTTAQVWLDFSLEIMKKVVTKTGAPDFEIRWPTVEEMRASAALLQRNRELGRLLKGVFSITDGARMPCAIHGDPFLENAYFEGYTQLHEATNVFVWNFFGEVIHAGINFPGSWHDSKVAAHSGLYHPKLDDAMTPPGFAILADSAFPRSTAVLNGKIVRARKANELSGPGAVPHSCYIAATEMLLDRAMPSERQSAEWGVRAIKGPFKRITVELPADSYTRYRLLILVAHLYNFRVRRVGLNQIRTVYSDPGYVQSWVQDLNQ